MAIWKCPACGHDKDIVCPVCGADKKAGETCSGCGSEFSHTTCPDCGHEEKYSEDEYPEDYFEKLKQVVGDRKAPYLTYFEVVRIAALLDHPLLRAVCLNEPSHVRAVTEEAFRSGGQDTLKELKGVDEVLAKGIMAIVDGV